MEDDYKKQFAEYTRCFLREIGQIKKDTGYSTDQVLMAMLIVATIAGKN